ncbi:sensor histidine kinase [Paenibacillus sp. CAU 1782]
MKSLRRRLAFHFIYQLVLTTIFLALLLIVALFLILDYISDKELEHNFSRGSIDSVLMEAYSKGDDIFLSPFVEELLMKHEMWVQVVDQDGFVKHVFNSPGDIPDRYSAPELLDIQHAGRLGKYEVNGQLDELTIGEQYLFLVGYQRPSRESLQQLYNAYEEGGLVPDKHKTELKAALAATGASLYIAGDDGEILQSFGKAAGGEEMQSGFSPLQIYEMQTRWASPGGAEIIAAVDAPYIWMLQDDEAIPSPKDALSMLQLMIRYLLAVALFILVLLAGLSLWHGYRYAQPMLLLGHWFGQLNNAEKGLQALQIEKKKIYRANGKMKIRFRLFRETIDAFMNMAEQMSRTEKQRQQFERNRIQWMSGISHDLRTPLSTIQGYGYILEREPHGWDQEQLRNMGSMIREKSDYMLELIEDFSLLEKLKRGPVIMDTAAIEVNELVRRVVLRYVNDATLNDVELECVTADEELYINGDAKLLQRLLDNVIVNAIKHNEPGILISVAVGKLPAPTDGAGDQGEMACIAISDNGQGMDEETQQKLFETYYRGTSTGQTSAGSGLGMSIANTIVQAHRGSISVESTLGFGSSITIQLPLRQP